MDDTQKHFSFFPTSKAYQKRLRMELLQQETVVAVMGEEKKGERYGDHQKMTPLRKYFPRNYTPKQMEGHHHQVAGTVAVQTAAAERADLYRNATQDPDGLFLQTKEKRL